VSDGARTRSARPTGYEWGKGAYESAAVIVVDVIEDMMVAENLRARRGRLTTAINALVQYARLRGFPVCWVRQEYAPALADAPLEYRRKSLRRTIAGTEGAQLLRELDVRISDHLIVKKRYSAFFRTDLESLLREWDVKSLLLAGVNTHACVRATALDAYQMDYPVYIVTECTGSYDEAHHIMSLHYLDGKIATVVTLAEVLGERDCRAD
jgi:nicotinamidase-related amidase